MKLVRTTLFWLHLTAGCLAGLVILAMSVTGLLLAFERQINAWADMPAVLENENDATPHVPLDVALTLLNIEGQGTPDQLVVHKQPNAPIEARYGRERTLLLNPWTAEVVGLTSERTRAFFGAVERIHRSLGLGMQSALGRGLTGAGNLVFLGLLLSGLYLWLPKVFQLASFRNRLMLRSGLNARARDWNWHHVVGIWSVVPLFFIVLTGVIMSYPWASNLLFKMTGSQPPVRGWRSEVPGHRNGNNAVRTAGSSVGPKSDRSLDEVAAAAMRQVPEWKSITINVPDSQDRTVNVSIDKSVGGQPEKSSQLIINREDGRIIAVKSFKNNNLGSKLRSWARFAHTGEEFGLTGQIIAAIACIGGIFLVWTGLSMATRRAMAAAARWRKAGAPAEALQSEPAA